VVLAWKTAHLPSNPDWKGEGEDNFKPFPDRPFYFRNLCLSDLRRRKGKKKKGEREGSSRDLSTVILLLVGELQEKKKAWWP